MNGSKSLMPVLFVGHGSPENVLNENAWTNSLKATIQKIPLPDAILIVSAHWLTNSLRITANPNPDLIYDFFGFPQPLYSVQYPAKGNPELALKVATLLETFEPQLDQVRGFDHGVWTVLYHLYPKAHIPVVQLSLSSKIQFTQYLEIGQKLAALREKKVLIIGSGNIVHNLRKLKSVTADPFDWAVQFDNWVTDNINTGKYHKLAQAEEDDKSLFLEAQPTPDHYLPLLICCGALNSTDKVSYPFQGFQYGSLSMRNILWNPK